MQDFKKLLKDKKYTKWSLFIILTGVLLYILYFFIKNLGNILALCGHGLESFFGALAPLFIGLVIAYIINPAVTKTDEKFISKLYKDLPDPKSNEKRQFKQRLVTTLITYIVILAAIFVVIYIFTTLLIGHLRVESIYKMVDSITSYIVTGEHSFKAWVAGLPGGFLSDKLSTIGDTVIHWVSANFNAQSAFDKITSFGGALVNLVLGVIVSFWLVLDKDFFKKGWNRFMRAILPGKGSVVLNNTLGEVDDIVSAFIRGILIDAVIISVLSSIVLSILGLKFAVLIGIFAGLCNVIPYFGPIMGMIPAFIVGFMNGGIVGGIIPVVALFIIQQVDSNLIYPKVVGGSTGLHPLLVLLAVIVGGAYGGIVGMIIAVPITSIIKLFLGKLIKLLERKKGISRDEDISQEVVLAENSETDNTDSKD